MVAANPQAETSMSLSVFDLFKIGIGPSSSHTVGPMRAAARFAEGLRREGLLEATASIKVELYGSLGATGKGHGSDKAVLLGLEGEQPDTVDTAAIPARLDAIRSSGELRLLGERPIRFVEKEHLALIRKPLAYHPNGMIFRAFDAAGLQVRSREYYSVGGGSWSTTRPPASTASSRTARRWRSPSRPRGNCSTIAFAKACRSAS